MEPFGFQNLFKLDTDDVVWFLANESDELLPLKTKRSAINEKVKQNKM
jgi:hypothetical protein